MTTGKSAFGAHITEEDQQVRQITASLDNLANALMQKNATIDNIVTSSVQLAQALQDMQAAMEHMFPSSQAQPHPSQGHHIGTTHRSTSPSTGDDGPTTLQLGQGQTHMGQTGLLLVPWAQGQGWSYKRDLLLPVSGPPARRHLHQYNGREFLQHRGPWPWHCNTSGPGLTVHHSGSCCR